MPLLIEIIGVEAGMEFVDDADFEFFSDEEFIFDDLAGRMRLSTENFAGTKYWSGDIINIEPIAWRTDQLYGGMVRLSGAGSIEIALSAFDSTYWWFPALTYACRISFTSGLEDAAEIIMDCSLELSEVNSPESITYKTIPQEFDVNLLSEAEDYDGNTVPLPIAFGDVTFVKPVRLADSVTLIDGWTQKPDMNPDSRSVGICAAVGTKIYFGLGLGSVQYNDWWVLDTAAQTYIWTKKTSYPGYAVESAVCAVVGTKIYAGTGYNTANGRQKDWYVYDTEDDTWTALTDFGGAARSSAVAAAVGDKVYVGTGYTTASTVDWWMYDTVADTWTAKADFAGAAMLGSGAVAVGTKIYTGMKASDDQWYMYDTVANTWTAKTDFPDASGRSGFVIVAIGTNIYVGTGNNGAQKKDMWTYDTVGNTWTQKADFVGAAREGAVAAVVGNDIYIGTGWYLGYTMKDWWKQGALAYQQQYSAGGMTAISVYDDGVDVSSNASAIVNNTFTYSVQPVGELTISGSGPAGNLKEIFDLICGSGWINASFVNDFYLSGESLSAYEVDVWVDSQIRAIDFLSNVAASCRNIFYVQGGVIYGHYWGTTYYTEQAIDISSDALIGTMYPTTPFASMIRHKYKKRVATEEAIGKYVKEIDEEYAYPLNYPNGIEIEFDAMSDNLVAIEAKVQMIYQDYGDIGFLVELPLSSITLKPSNAVTLTDTRADGWTISFQDAYIKDIVFDFINKKITIEGTGSISSPYLATTYAMTYEDGVTMIYEDGETMRREVDG